MTSTKNESQDADMPSQFFEENAKPEPEKMAPSAPTAEEVAELRAALVEATEKSDSIWQRLLRREAEFQNLERRSQQEVERNRLFAMERISKDLLQILDSFEQGILFSDKEMQASDMLEGMKLTYQMLLDILEKHGITGIKVEVGQTFDPSFHEALSLQETSDLAPNQVLAVIQKGYTLHQRLLRPVRVIVSKAVGA